MSIKERFEDFKTPSYFSRVDPHHPLEIHIGLDEKSRKALELRAHFKPRKISGTEAIDVTQYTKPEYNTLRFSLRDIEMCGLFYKFCEDLTEETRNIQDVNQGYQVIVNRFYQWKKMFVLNSKTYLSESEIMGLIGEILFLKGSLAGRIGISDALQSWSGQELTHKDFSYGNNWYEVKAISRGKDTVRIASLEQLDSSHRGELVVFVLEKMSETYSGISLNTLVLETVRLFSSQDEKDDFITKVSVHGYNYSDYYDTYVYEVSSMIRYRVDDKFPKLTKKDVPVGITKASYEISLVELRDFEMD